MAEETTNNLALGNAEPPAPEPRVIHEADGLNAPIDPSLYASGSQVHQTSGNTQEMPPAPAPGPQPGFNPKKPEPEGPAATSPQPMAPVSKHPAFKVAGLVAALIAAFAAGYGLGTQRVIDTANQQQEQQEEEPNDNGSAQKEDGASSGKDDSGKDSNSSTESNEDDTSSPSTEDTSAGEFDVSSIAGEKWSNAKKILTSNGIDLDDVIVLTDDGKQVIVDSNWSVDDAYRRGKSITVQLKHDTDTVKEAGDALGNLLSGNTKSGN